MKLRAIIVDDERHSLETTTILIRRNCPDVEIIGTFTDPEEAIRVINSEEPDLLLLDISMPVISGFELLKRLTCKNCEKIFTTAYEEYALEGIRAGALHYLLKPIDEMELCEGIQRVREKKQVKAKPVVSGQKPRIPISSLNGVELIDVETIIRCESDGNYTVIILPGRKITVSKTLKEIERQLAENPIFFRLHNSHLVNVTHITKYIRGEGGSVILSNHEEIGVSRSRKNDLLEVLGIS